MSYLTHVADAHKMKARVGSLTKMHPQALYHPVPIVGDSTQLKFTLSNDSYKVQQKDDNKNFKDRVVVFLTDSEAKSLEQLQKKLTNQFSKLVPGMKIETRHLVWSTKEGRPAVDLRVGAKGVALEMDSGASRTVMDMVELASIPLWQVSGRLSGWARIKEDAPDTVVFGLTLFLNDAVEETNIPME